MAKRPSPATLPCDGGAEAIRWLREHGKLSDIAVHLGVTKQAAYKWRRVPAERVQRVAQITGLEPQFLRPDIFGKCSSG
jgi:hypothetical protein